MPSGSNAVMQDVRLPMTAAAEVAQARSRTSQSRTACQPDWIKAQRVERR